jgi:hypothetical protein
MVGTIAKSDHGAILPQALLPCNGYSLFRADILEFAYTVLIIDGEDQSAAPELFDRRAIRGYTHLTRRGFPLPRAAPRKGDDGE